MLFFLAPIKQPEKNMPKIFLVRILFVYLHIGNNERNNRGYKQNLTQKVAQKFFRFKYN